jgi:hypothetical protein
LHDTHSKKRINATLGLFPLLISYATSGIDGDEFALIMTIINHYISLDVDETVPPLLSLVNALVASGAMSPSLFADTPLGMIVNRQIAAIDNRSTAVACEIWENLVHRGSSGRCVDVDAVLDVVDCERGRAVHAALRLVEALLRESTDLALFVASLVSDSPTNRGFQTFLSEKVKRRDFETFRACGACTALIVLAAGPADMDILALPEEGIVSQLFDFLEVEENRIPILEAVGVIFEFAHSRGGEQWAGIHQQWLMADGPEKMLELTQEEGGGQFVAFQDRFFEMLEIEED